MSSYSEWRNQQCEMNIFKASVRQLGMIKSKVPCSKKKPSLWPLKGFYKASSFGSIWPTNMAAKINSFFWLANVKKISSETARPNGAKLGRKHLCKVQTWHRWSLGVSLSRWLLFFKVMIISLWNLLQYHSIVRWAIQAQWVEPIVFFMAMAPCYSSF